MLNRKLVLALTVSLVMLYLPPAQAGDLPKINRPGKTLLFVYPNSGEKGGYEYGGEMYEDIKNPPTFTAPVSQYPGIYKTWFEAMGVKVQMVIDRKGFETAFKNRNFDCLTITYHGFVDTSWLTGFVKNQGNELKSYVENGGTLVLVAGRDREELPLAALFGLKVTEKPFDVVDLPDVKNKAKYAVTLRENTPFSRGVARVDTTKGDASFVEYGYLLPLPGWVEITGVSITDWPGKEHPVLVAGKLGKGKIVLTTCEINNPDNLGFNILNKTPDIPELFQLWVNIFNYLSAN